MKTAEKEIVIKICPKAYADGYIEPILLPEEEIRINPDESKRGECWFRMRRKK